MKGPAEVVVRAGVAFDLRAVAVALAALEQPHLHAVDELMYLTGYEYSGDLLAAARAAAQQLLDDAQARTKAAGVACDAQLIDDLGPRLGELVARVAHEWKADLIVLGTHGRRGFNRLLLGSGAEQVIRLAPVPVMVVRPNGTT